MPCSAFARGQSHHLLHARRYCLPSAAFPKGKPEQGSSWEIIPAVKASWVSYTKLLLFLPGVVSGIAEPCSVASFGLAQLTALERSAARGIPPSQQECPGQRAPCPGHLPPADLWFPWLCLVEDIFVCSGDTRVRWFGIILSEARVNRFHTESPVRALFRQE